MDIAAAVPTLRAVEAEQAAAPPPEFFARLIASVDSHAMILLDTTGRVMTWNPGAERIKGFAADEIVGESFTRFYPPEAIAVEHPRRELEIAGLTGRYEEEGWRVRRDGSRFWARVLIIALRDDEGDLMGFGKVTSDLTEDRQRQEQVANTMRLLEQTIRIDNLTGLHNRRAWDERMAEEIARVTRHPAPLAIAVIDLDHFKQVNDQFGHAEGDRLLKQAALSWSRSLRPTDVLARYGGEEFAVALPGCDIAAAMPVLERLRAATPGTATCSIGVAQYETGESPSDVVGRADRAMYTAKNRGRDQVIAA